MADGFFGFISEMIGKIKPPNVVFGGVDISSVNLYSNATSVDYAKVNYALTKALFYACEYEDPVTGKKYGKEFILGASFAKPIVNIAAAFMIGKLPTVTLEPPDTVKKKVRAGGDNADPTDTAVTGVLFLVD